MCRGLGLRSLSEKLQRSNIGWRAQVLQPRVQGLGSFRGFRFRSSLELDRKELHQILASLAHTRNPFVICGFGVRLRI